MATAAEIRQGAIAELARRELERRQSEQPEAAGGFLRKAGSTALRQTGLTARAALEGANDVISPFTNAAAGLINIGLEATPIERRLPEQTQNFSNLLTDLGLPTPETPGEKGGNIGGRFITSMASGQPVSKLITRAIAGPTTAVTKLATPTLDELRTQSQAAYRAAEQSGVNVSKGSFSVLIDKIVKVADKAGIDPTLHPKATAALQRLSQAAADDIPFEQLETLRRVVKGAASSIEKDERRIAQIIAGELDDYVGALSKADVTSGDARIASTAITTARNLWSRFSKGEAIEEMIERAKVRAPNFSASGLENSLRTEFRRLALNPRRMRLFSKPEQEAIKKVAQGGPLDNALRMLGKLAPRGVISTALSGGMGFAVAGPAGAGAVLGVGETARQGATALTLRNARLASELARRGIPPEIISRLLPEAAQGLPFGVSSVAGQLLNEPESALASQ